MHNFYFSLFHLSPQSGFQFTILTFSNLSIRAGAQFGKSGMTSTPVKAWPVLNKSRPFPGHDQTDGEESASTIVTWTEGIKFCVEKKRVESEVKGFDSGYPHQEEPSL